MHKESGHGTFGGVVPVIGGFVMAAAARKMKGNGILGRVCFIKENKFIINKWMSIKYYWKGKIRIRVEDNISQSLKVYLPATSAKAMITFIFI